jgi:formate hydrogenlyase subunit 3/multisubunit Na+/H+ antiporter MnhD subunit
MILNIFMGVIVVLGLLLFFVKNNRFCHNIHVLSAWGILLCSLIYLSFGFLNGGKDLLSFFYFEDATFVVIVLFMFAFAMGLIFMLTQEPFNYKEMGLLFLYFATAVAAVSSTSLINLFIYWELLALFAVLIILMSKHADAQKVAMKYFAIHIFGGVLFLVGLVDFVNAFGTDGLDLPLKLSENWVHYFILIAILINLGLPPFGSWIVDGYSKCSPMASIFLSVFTTKVALFVLMKLFQGNGVLVYFGLAIAIYGAVFCLINKEIRRLLSLSIIHQMGMAVVAIAALDLFYDQFLVSFIAVNVLYKMVFFMIGFILLAYYKTEDIYRLKGMVNVKSIMGVFLVFAAVQALGLPLSGGFVAKNYLGSLAELLGLPWLNWVLILLAAMVAWNVGIKIPYKLLQFKNLAPNVGFNNKLTLLPFILIIVFLEGIYVFNMGEFAALKNFLHFAEILVLASVLYYLGNKLFLGKEAILNDRIDNFKEVLSIKTLAFLKLVSHFNLNGYIAMYSKKAYVKLTPNLNQKHYHSTSLVLFALLGLLVFFLILRVF